MHERLGVDVLVVLGEIESTSQGFVDNASVVASGETKFRFDRRPKKWATKLVESLALDHDPSRRSVECFEIGHGNTHVFEAQCFDWLKTENIADD